ncbi:MAG: TolC family protein, partial [Elusimicrobiaceae bacterium]
MFLSKLALSGALLSFFAPAALAQTASTDTLAEINTNISTAPAEMGAEVPNITTQTAVTTQLLNSITYQVQEPSVDNDDVMVSTLALRFNIPQKHKIAKGETLTLQKCIEIALDQDPDLLNKQYAALGKQAEVKGAKSTYYPQIDASVSAYRYGAPYTNTNDTRVALQQGTYTQGAAGVTLKQLLLDFGSRSGSINSSRSAYAASRQDLEDLATTVTNSVKKYYYNVIQARRALEVNKEKVAQFKQNLSVAQAMFKNGQKPKYDVTKAETDLSGAQLDLIKARNDYDLAWVSLNSLMFLISPQPFHIEDNLDYVDYNITLDEILSKAFLNRPDLKMLQEQYNAMQFTLKATRSAYYPSLYANGAYNTTGTESPYSQNWNAGLSLQLNIFQGMKTRAAVEQNTAQLNSVRAQIYSKGRQIYLEAAQSVLNLNQSEERIINAQAQVKQATENLQIATVRYNTGISTPLELTDATTAYSSAKLQLIKALFDFKVAQADIEKAMG